MIAPEVIAQLKWDGKLSWYTEDQMRFQGAQSAIDYVTRERSKNIQTLKPGKYNLEYTSVDQQDDRIVIKTKTGEKIIIQLGDD
jgi:predicted  nucleic acid-binding Zn-ribbon protein